MAQKIVKSKQVQYFTILRKGCADETNHKRTKYYKRPQRTTNKLQMTERNN